MPVVWVLVACLALAANAEWVQISQQHYRKPLRGHSHAGVEEPVRQYNPSEETQLAPNLHREDIQLQKQYDSVRHTYYPSEVETQITQYTKKQIVRDDSKQHIRAPDSVYSHEDETAPLVFPKGNRIYLNQSLPEHSWNQKANVLDKSGNIILYAGDFKVKPNVTPEFSLEIYGALTEMPESDIRNRLTEQDKFPATIERVPNTGSVKRVQLSNTPVKAPASSKPVSPIRRSDLKKHESDPIDEVFSDELNISPDIFKKTKNEEINTSPVNVLNYDLNTKEKYVGNYDRITIPSYSSTSTPMTPFDKYLTANSYTKINETKNNNCSYGNGTNKVMSTIKENRITDTKVQIENLYKVKTDQTETRITSNDNYKTPEKHVDNFKEPVKYVDFEEVVTSNDEEIKSKRKKYPSNANSQFVKDPNEKPNSDSSSSGEESKMNKKPKVNMIENVLKFMKVVADTISKNTRRGIEGKVRYLNELKDTLLSNIRGRVDAAWPEEGARRRSRSAVRAQARGHVEFPSSESALMTISFLTFAVFLIKLVLQVIQTYKNKTMMVAPLVVATAGRAVRKLRTAH